MKQKKDPYEKIETKYLPTKFMLTVRIMVALYLLYTAYSLLEGVMTDTGKDRIFFGAFMIAFTVIGIFLLIFSLKSMTIGKYAGGALDAGDPEPDVPSEAELSSESEGKKDMTVAEQTEKKEIEEKELTEE